MELYTLDGQLRRTELVEAYESFIWAERYRAVGDLNIVLPSTQQNRNLLATGTLLGLSESDRVMRVETIEDKEAEDGSKKLYVTCAEFSKILYDRVAQTATPGVAPGTWKATGMPSDIVRELFDYVCRDGLSDPTDMFPLLTTGSLYDPGTLPEDTATYTLEREHGPLFDAMNEILGIWNLGMRIYKGQDDGTLYFDVYTGDDRTTSQTTFPAVIFSPDLDSLQSITELTTNANSKNVAHVQGKYGTVMAYQDGATYTTTGISKRVLFVKADDIDYAERTYTLNTLHEAAINKLADITTVLDDGKVALQKLIDYKRLDPGEPAIISAYRAAALTATLINSTESGYITAAVAQSTGVEAAETAQYNSDLAQKGSEELAKYRSYSAFDGEITQLSPYKYRTHYFMGDLVEMRTDTGVANQMLVTEQIFASDESGEKAYPTLAIDLFVQPGTWLAWENTQVWEDAPGTWATS